MMNPQQERAIEVLISTFNSVKTLIDHDQQITTDQLLEIIAKSNYILKNDFPQIVQKMTADDI